MYGNRGTTGKEIYYFKNRAHLAKILKLERRVAVFSKTFYLLQYANRNKPQDLRGRLIYGSADRGTGGT